LSVGELARALDVHANTIRFHLDALIDDGRVESVAEARGGLGRPAMVFRARRKMHQGEPTNYRLLAEIMTAHLAATEPDASETATALGRTWGASLIDGSDRAVRTRAEAVKRLVGLLGDLGFAPETSGRGARTEIGLRHCPFLDLVTDHREVICPLHLGLMQGAMEAMEAPISVRELAPFAEPDLCVAHLGHSRRP
jgi:predicted ArsR family transcriptional regulator